MSLRPAEAAREKPRRRRNRRGEGERLRREVLDATTALLSETGDAAQVSMRDIAAAAGITPPAIYRLFPNKEALLRSVITERFAAFDSHLDDASTSARRPRECLEQRCLAYLDFAATHPGHYRILFSATALGPPMVGAAEHHPGARSFDALVAAVAACTDGTGPGQRAPFVVAVELWAFLHGLADLCLTKPEFPWPDVGPLALDAVDRLLGPG